MNVSLNMRFEDPETTLNQLSPYLVYFRSWNY